MDTITTEEAKNRNFIDKETGEYNTDRMMIAEYGDLSRFLDSLDHKLREKSLRLVLIDAGISDWLLFIDDLK